MSWLPQPNLCGFNHQGNNVCLSKTTHDSHLPFSILLPLWRCGILQSELRDLTTYALQHWKQVWVQRNGFWAQQSRHGSGGLVLVAGRQKLPEAIWQICAWLCSCRTRSPISSWQTAQGSSSHEQRNESIEHVWFILDTTHTKNDCSFVRKLCAFPPNKLLSKKTLFKSKHFMGENIWIIVLYIIP